MTDSLDFLTAKLSPFREQYYSTILETTPALLALYDERVLGGYSEENLASYQGSRSYHDGWTVAYTGASKEGLASRDTDDFVAQMADGLQKTEDPVAFMYGVRQAFINIGEIIRSACRSTKEKDCTR